MYPVNDLIAEARANSKETPGDSDLSGKVIGYTGEVLTMVGTLAVGLGVLAAETVWKSAPKMLRAAGSTLRTFADSMEKCE